MSTEPTDATNRVKRATPSDLDALVPLFDSYRRFYGQPSQPDICREFLRARFDREESAIFIAVAEDHGAVGFTQLFPSFSSVRVRPIWWLNDLYVTASSRGLGFGRALLDAAATHARATSAAGLMLETLSENAYAQELYERHGYERLDPGSRFYWLSTE